MAKLSKTTRTVIIAAAVLLVLGAALLVLMLTGSGNNDDTSGAVTNESSTSEADSSGSDGTSSDSGSSSGDSDKIAITEKEQENVLKMEVTNSTGSYSFERQQREVSSTDDDGNVSTTTEYYWISPELEGVDHNDSTIGSFVRAWQGCPLPQWWKRTRRISKNTGLRIPRRR